MIKGVLSDIIPKNQGGFIHGHQITDNIILVQEAIHNSIQRNEKGKVVNINLSNAFDSVRFDFLFKILAKLGFDLDVIKWINSCIGDPWIAPLGNGTDKNFFKALRGLKQGFPLPPLLFFIFASTLSFQLDKSHLDQDLLRVQIVRGVKEINHAQFADDTLLLGGASIQITSLFNNNIK